MSHDRPRSYLGVVVFSVLLVILVTLVVLGIVTQVTDRHPTGSGSGESVSTPASEASSAPTPDPSTSPVERTVMDDIETQNLPEVFSPIVSAAPRPSDELILQYERAFYSSDPTEREALMQTLATDQYLEEELNREPVKYPGIEVRVVEPETVIDAVVVGESQFTAYVSTTVFLETVRDGEVVNRFKGPRHASVWVNTPSGWRVATNAGED